MGNVAGFGYTEINKLEHCARLLQKNIRTIVSEAPTLAQLAAYESAAAVDRFTQQEARDNRLVRLVAKLKTLHAAGQLAVFDRILCDDVRVDTPAAAAGTPAPRAPQAPEKPPPDDAEPAVEGLPALPAIRGPALRLRVFQHKSTCANKTYLNEQEIVASHNERLEFLGDSVLNTLVTYILYERFPAANEGQLSQIRSQLVSNKVLGEFAVAYGFDKKLRCNIDEDALKTGRQKVFADVFEAYVGGLATERTYDLQEVQRWLALLYAHKIAVALREMNSICAVDKEAKTELYSMIGTASLHPVYKVITNGNGVSTPFKVHCLMEGEFMGAGEAPSLKEAGLRAAMSALSNKRLVEKYGRKRLQTDRSISEVKQDKAAPGGAGKPAPVFPLVAGKAVFPNKFAKNEVYAYFGKNLGLAPEYIVTYEEQEKRYKAELKVNQAVLSVAYDTVRRNAITRAATVLLENKHLLHDIVSLVN
ncbi:hypothetical protein METBIDRAFT_39396 [Metschnikowia bicuspidata var. bicuspidata NRRL YB-4993]|uniref:ribonuclease III n=1 Tax=Metschnikowia bicuspidata var. bicuspidata NRRL YB-4993 TaxID=869754 RepID=A0A1A0HEQ2_9ASCO|nr:hypothetical protein METBIDRAFT_39396 [Metschnikowia bicuspidata var. bicuspidata NRRL YB-4993]OBA22388.1 hypothetical protein METBIDRAFT_39396 [Metschnikowia bicuspidata var. bicuspidata NRRL YB-4993]